MKDLPPAREAPVELSSAHLKRNAILIGLAGGEAELVLAQATLVVLPVRFQIYWPNEPIRDVYFPLDCVLSIVTRMRDGSQIEVGTVGCEGVSAIPLLLGGSSTANESYCQVPGTAIKMSAALFSSLKDADPAFRALLDRFVQSYVNMLGQLAACNRLHNVDERCARWLLMTQDRVGRDEISLTHEYLAMMLGAQRSGVTIAVGILQKAGFIKHSRGTFTILDRAGLEGSSCECYDVAKEQFGALLGSIEPAGSARGR